MYGSFYDEFSKIARQTSTARKGEGSRGGKVIGRTKSGKPIYESSQKSTGSVTPGKVAPPKAKPPAAPSAKKKSFWKRHGKALGIAGGALGGAAVLGALAGRAARKAPAGGGFKFKFDLGGGSSGFKWGGDWDKKQRAWDRASKAYQQAGGSGGPTRGAKASREAWENYKKAGDDYFGRGSGIWEKIKDFQQKTYEGWKSYHKQRAGRGAGGRGARGGSRGRYRPPPPPPPPRGFSPGTHIPGLGDLKTKVDAKKAYKAAAMKNHPDRGGSTAKMQDVNAEWEAFRHSAAWEKLAMVRYWSALANALIR